MIIRNVTAEDHALYLALSAEFYSDTIANLHSFNAEYVERTFQQCVSASPYASAVILEENEKPAGYALFSFTWSSESGGFVVLLEEFYIRKECRGLRLGTRFLEWMMEKYKDASRIRLEVTSCNLGAKRLYEHFGFQKLDYEQMVWEHSDEETPV